MFVNPSKEYPLVFIFSIAQSQKERKDYYECTRKYWKDIKNLISTKEMVAVGLIDKIACSVYKIDKWIPTSNPEQAGKYEFIGHEEIELTEDFLNTDFTNVLEPHKGYWGFAKWIAVSFNKDGSVSYLRPATPPEKDSKKKLNAGKTLSKKVIPVTKDFVGNEIREKIREIGKLWNRNLNKRVFPEPAYSDWQKLIEFWRDCPDLPLVIRKNKEHRGESIIHPSGREIIFSDNSFATWVLCNVLENKTITVLEIKKLLEDDQIPFMMVANKNAKYKKTQEPNTTDGWKLCHKEEVGFKTRKSVNELDIKLIERKFFLFANPKNMFLLPKDIGGIGEIKEFIEEQTN